MARLSWKVSIGLVLVLSSAFLCLLHILLFRDAKTLFFYLFLDIVFVPVQVLLVTVIIEKLLSEREKQAMMQKLNMVIGAFFSEVGRGLMVQMKGTCLNFEDLQAHLSIHPQWPKGSYRSAKAFVEHYVCRFGFERSHLNELHEYLVSKRPFVLALLQNPNLLDHDAFTSLLWAVCHLTEELDARTGVEFLPPSDVRHLEADIQRAFGMLVREWLTYMQHLRDNYPYIYSLAIRINPFNPQASPVIGE